jgi:hypothetical protein
LHGSLIVLYGALILQHQLFLVIQDLLGDAFTRPRRTVTIKVHLRLRQYVLVPLECSLGLDECGLLLTIIDVYQRISLLDDIALLAHFQGVASKESRNTIFQCSVA